MNPKKILSSITIGAGAIIIGLGLQYALAAWTPAPNSPPNCPSSISGCNAPVNVGTGAQAKAGGLSVGTVTPPSGYSFDTVGGASIDTLLTQAFTLADSGAIAGQDAGKVLSSNAYGVAAWVATSSLGFGGGGSSAVTKIVAGTGISINPTTGTGTVTINNSGVTKITAGANITISPTTGTGAVSISASNSGTIGGECYIAEASPFHGEFIESSWGVAAAPSGNVANFSCTCPSGYQLVNVLDGSYIENQAYCIAN